MVGDDAVARLHRPVGIDLRQRRHRKDDGAHEVGVVVRRLALQDRGDALEPHARVDGRARQQVALARRLLLELHEDEVPELEEPVAILLRAARRPAVYAFSLVVEDLRTGAARARVPHGPEIVRGGDADDAVVREAGDLLPKIIGVVVIVVDGHQQATLVEAEMLGDQRPGKLDGHRLEVVAEREIAEHLKEGVVARRVADVVEVVVLAAGADALLGRRGPRVRTTLKPREDVLELHHPGVGEHQRRVVARHQRARGDDLVALAPEELQEGRPDIADTAHVVHKARRSKGKTGATASAGRLLFLGRINAAREAGATAPSPQWRCARAQASAASSSGSASPRIFSPISPAFSRISCSMRRAASGLPFRKVLAFSRP